MRLDSRLVLVPVVAWFVRNFWLGHTVGERVDVPRYGGRGKDQDKMGGRGE